MGLEFNRNKAAKGARYAWNIFQQRLNENGGILLEIFSGKDLVELSMKIESNLNAAVGGASEESGLDYVRKFLEGKTEKRVN